jgi:hypothetical protein
MESALAWAEDDIPETIDIRNGEMEAGSNLAAGRQFCLEPCLRASVKAIGENAQRLIKSRVVVMCQVALARQNHRLLRSWKTK